MNLSGLVAPGKELSDQERQHIQELQEEIDAIWNQRGNYKVTDDEEWRRMPLFMETITQEDMETNENCAALASIIYDEVPAEERAVNRKEHGNRALQLAQTPGQTNPQNLARAAVHCYTEGLDAKCSDREVNCHLYANRSLAHFIMQNYGHGLADAQKAIILVHTYSKAYYRAARNAERIKKYDMAVNLLEKGIQTLPESDAKGRAEMEALLQVCRAGLEAAETKAKAESLKTRVAAAQVGNIMRAITSHGIRVGPRPEVRSDQMAVYDASKPYFDTEDVLHVPILFMYDEYQQTDFMKDVACDVSMADIVEEMMPFPWDNNGRYTRVEDLRFVYKIDDGVAMPQYYAVDPSWLLIEVLRSPTYQMPGLLPVFHIIAASSALAQEWNIQDTRPT